QMSLPYFGLLIHKSDNPVYRPVWIIYIKGHDRSFPLQPKKIILHVEWSSHVFVADSILHIINIFPQVIGYRAVKIGDILSFFQYKMTTLIINWCTFFLFLLVQRHFFQILQTDITILNLHNQHLDYYTTLYMTIFPFFYFSHFLISKT
ncbi:hypothetical protein ACJX0J_039345, partial [Zea mays]